MLQLYSQNSLTGEIHSHYLHIIHYVYNITTEVASYKTTQYSTLPVIKYSQL